MTNDELNKALEELLAALRELRLEMLRAHNRMNELQSTLTNTIELWSSHPNT